MSDMSVEEAIKQATEQIARWDGADNSVFIAAHTRKWAKQLLRVAEAWVTHMRMADASKCPFFTAMQ